VLLQELVRTSEAVAATTSRRSKTELLAGLLTQLANDEIVVAVSFLSGEPRQRHLGLGPATIHASTPPPAAIATLTIPEVDVALQGIEDTASGAGSRTQRVDRWTDLLARATAEEQQWLRRLVLRELRQGALAGVLLPAVARSATLPVDTVRRAAMLSGDLPATAQLALHGGAAALASVRLTLGVPLDPMLASTASTLGTALRGGGDGAEVVVETKLDGARLQLHVDGEQVHLFTRTGQEVTERLPELVELARRLPADSFVLDAEALAFDDQGRPRPFQDTMQRIGRERDIDRWRRELPISLRAFDLLHLDGTDLLDEPLVERRAALHRLVPEGLRAESIVTERLDVAQRFAAHALAAGHEGVIVKDLDAPYAAGRRGASWRKVKPIHTLDLVVLAAEWGSGRRRGWLSNLHLGARAPHPGTVDPDHAGDDHFVLLGKTFKGLTDEVLAWQTAALLARETHRDGHVVHVRPELVVEIALDGVVRSSRYPGGVALRFARVRGYRPDKPPSQADTLATVQAIHAGTQRPTLA
jgi:DNA ligase 1